MNNGLKQFLKYIRNPANEFGFMVLFLKRKQTGFQANIFIDDNGSWINLDKNKIILFQANNNVDADFEKSIPMSIENEPQILVKNDNIYLTDFELEQIKGFVRKCQKELTKISNGEIDAKEFLDIVKSKGFYLTIAN